MKQIYLTLCFLFLFLSSLILKNTGGEVFGQTPGCQPFIKIDGNLVTADGSAAGMQLPVWLKSGQTIATASMVNSISIIEFNIVNGNTLQFSQVVSITSSGTVPNSAAWKVESIVKQPSFGTTNSITYSTPGTYTFTVPYCASTICIQAWGGGGGGGGTTTTNGGGGGGSGGGYGQQCFAVTPNSTFTVTVGAGGSVSSSSNGNTGGTSSVGAPIIISATGGGGGGVGPTGTGNTSVGTSTATNNVSGLPGNNGSSNGGSGGQGANGGNGGAQVNSSGNGNAGSPPGGGGGGAATNSNVARPGGAGGAGQVIITW